MTPWAVNGSWPTRWASQTFLGAQASSFFTVADPARPSASHTGAVGLRAELLLEYHAHYAEHDEWVKAALRRTDFATGVVTAASMT